MREPHQGATSPRWMSLGTVLGLAALAAGIVPSTTDPGPTGAPDLDANGDGRLGRFEAAAAGFALGTPDADPEPGATWAVAADGRTATLAGDLGPDAPAIVLAGLLRGRALAEVHFGVVGDEARAHEVAALLRASDVATRLTRGSVLAPGSPLLTASTRRYVDPGARVWTDAARSGSRPAGAEVLALATEASGLEVFTVGDGRASLRGLSAVDADIAWVTGSGGTVAVTLDGGRRWIDVAPADFHALDVRDVHALDGERAWILTSGPGELSRILYTGDGGVNWTEQHRETEAASFLDGFAFWDERRAIAYGDPLPGVGFRVLVTEDGGAHWEALPAGPAPLESGEASFAASGTGVVTDRRTSAWIATGANDARARVFRSDDFGRTWRAAETTIPAPKPAAGAFSVAFGRDDRGVAVGGDFTAREVGGAAVASYTEDGGRTWKAAEVGPRGQRAGCTALADGRTFIATGQTGSDVTRDGGRTWSALSSEGFHCVAVAPADGAIWFAGHRGRAARLR